jgi:hypothetical protein
MEFLKLQHSVVYPHAAGVGSVLPAKVCMQIYPVQFMQHTFGVLKCSVRSDCTSIALNMLTQARQRERGVCVVRCGVCGVSLCERSVGLASADGWLCTVAMLWG